MLIYLLFFLRHQHAFANVVAETDAGFYPTPSKVFGLVSFPISCYITIHVNFNEYASFVWCIYLYVLKVCEKGNAIKWKAISFIVVYFLSLVATPENKFQLSLTKNDLLHYGQFIVHMLHKFLSSFT